MVFCPVSLWNIILQVRPLRKLVRTLTCILQTILVTQKVDDTDTSYSLVL